MLKKTAVFLVVIAVVFLSQITVFAADTTAKTESTTNDINSIYDTSALYDSLSDDVKQSLENIGINGIDSNELSQISFGEVVNEIVKLAGENSAGPLKAVISLTALLLICSLLSSYKNSLSSELSSSLGIAAVLPIESRRARSTTILFSFLASSSVWIFSAVQTGICCFSVALPIWQSVRGLISAFH